MADRILVVDDEEIIRESLSFILKKEGYDVTEASNGKEAYEKILADPFDIVVSDIEMPEMKGIELLEQITHVSPETLVVIITAHASIETAIEALRKGASDYILKPIEFDELIVKIHRLLEHRRLSLENKVLRQELLRKYDFAHLIGKSTAMKKVFSMLEKVAPTESTVLITGKSGTGKELVARALHYNSKRGSKPFIAVNCGAIPETLIESELFGHKKGAFTGATTDKEGYFKAADGGTLFLDEISEMPLPLQVRLLRVIEQKEIVPVGTSRTIPVNVRFVAATNRELLKEVEAGRFREDLLYRFNVVEIHLPTLTERTEDIPLLVERFVEKYRNEMAKNIQGVNNEVMHLLMNHEWRGEVRELENIIERAVIFCNDEFITVKDLPEFMQQHVEVPLPPSPLPASLKEAIENVEKQVIYSALQRNNHDKEKTSLELKVSLPTLYRRIKDLGIVQ
jgi:two-component system response regulator PilR (NtrC family)